MVSLSKSSGPNSSGLKPPAPTPDRSVVRRLYGLLTPYRRTVLLGMICLIASVAAELYPPLVWGRVVDRGLMERDWNYIGWQLALLVAVFAVQQVLSAWRGLLLERAGQQLTLDLRMRISSLSARAICSHGLRQTWTAFRMCCCAAPTPCWATR
jgi:ATP-binding cassette subfamily B protein